MADVRELAKHPSPRYSAAPLEDNVFEWHFSIRGPTGSDFEGDERQINAFLSRFPHLLIHSLIISRFLSISILSNFILSYYPTASDF